MDHAALLPKILATMFPDNARRAQVEAILSAYGAEEHHGESPRVKIAILKAAGADLGRIRRYTEVARVDYRDILCLAEYPGQSKRWSLRDTAPEEHQKLVNEDLRQYEVWIARVSAGCGELPEEL